MYILYYIDMYEQKLYIYIYIYTCVKKRVPVVLFFHVALGQPLLVDSDFGSGLAFHYNLHLRNPGILVQESANWKV